MAIRAITFDFWGTLFRDVDVPDRREVRVDALCAATGADREDAREALQIAEREFFRVHVEEQRNLTPIDAVRITCEFLNTPLGPEEAAALAHAFASAIFTHPPVPVDGALDAVLAAASRCPIAVISDSGISPGSSLRILLDQHGFTPHFRALTFSDEIGVSKPQARMFETTAEKLGVAPSEIFHLGDLEPTDIAGIHGVGGTGGLFAGVNTRFYDATAAAHRFRTWSEFIDVLPDLLSGGA